MSQVPPHTLETSLSIQGCIDRLHEAVDEMPTGPFDASTPYRGREYVGQISEGEIRIFRRTSNLGSFRPTLIGSLHRCDRGAQLRYRVGLMPQTVEFMAVWFGGVAFVLLILVGALVFGSVSTPLERTRLLEGIVICCGFDFIGGGALLWEKSRVPDEEQHLARLVTEALASPSSRDAV
jgi:hypothetical protein